jgi:hypothetical protein
MKERDWLKATGRTSQTHPGHWEYKPEREGGGFRWVPATTHYADGSKRVHKETQ